MIPTGHHGSDKAGTFVPGTGRRSHFRDHLLDQPAQIMPIGAQWRAAGIVVESERSGIAFDRILIENEGRLVYFLHDDHPYRSN